MDSPLEYVKQLEIESPNFQVCATPPSVQLSASKEQGFVVAGSLVSFVGNIGTQEREDVINSTLLAQLAADKKFDRKKQTEEWYGYYVKVLSELGWVLRDFSFKKYKSSEETMNISTAILDVLHANVNQKEITGVKKTIHSLQRAENEPWWVIFSNRSSGPSADGNLQVLLCKVDSTSQVAMSIGCFCFSAETIEKQWLWYDYISANMSLHWSTQTSTLNMTFYNQIRDEVIKKLHDRINPKDLIGDLEL